MTCRNKPVYTIWCQVQFSPKITRYRECNQKQIGAHQYYYSVGPLSLSMSTSGTNMLTANGARCSVLLRWSPSECHSYLMCTNQHDIAHYLISTRYLNCTIWESHHAAYDLHLKCVSQQCLMCCTRQIHRSLQRQFICRLSIKIKTVNLTPDI
jgi:hypothetical protein